MKRKRLIDRKLQLKTSFAVIRFYFVAFFIGDQVKAGRTL